MKILNDQEAEEARKYFEEAGKIAESSLCLRAQCGSVIVKDGRVVGTGFNSPPQNDPNLRTCLNEYDIPANFRHDRTCCIHAEQRAIVDARARNEEIKGSAIYFTRIEEDKKRAPSHRLCCTICSRAVLDAGIAEFLLEWEDGSIRSWPTDEFDKLSFENKTPLK